MVCGKRKRLTPIPCPFPRWTSAQTLPKSSSASPNISSKKWVWEQYDNMVGTLNRSTNRPSDAGVVSVRGTDKALALTVDCNARYVEAIPNRNGNRGG